MATQHDDTIVLTHLVMASMTAWLSVPLRLLQSKQKISTAMDRTREPLMLLI